jgi:hypothetical protein
LLILSQIILRAVVLLVVQEERGSFRCSLGG